jgi:peroxiredoxin Q/BCP
MQSMNLTNTIKHTARILSIFALWWSVLSSSAEPPQIGEMAPEFKLKGLDGTSIRLNEISAKSRVVLVVLRGWPGYQCPLCTQQVHELVTGASELRKRHVKMVFVYPGPAQALQEHAAEFLKDKDWPKDFLFAPDPDYMMVNAYSLRWNANGETAYPSTFIIDRGGKVGFAKVSKEHGGRVKLSDLLQELDRKR